MTNNQQPDPISNLPKQEILLLLKRAEDLGDLALAINYREQLAKAAPNRSYRGDLVECLRWAERSVAVLVRRGQRGPNAWIATRGSNLTGGNGEERAHPRTMAVAKTFFNNDSTFQSFSYAMADVTEGKFARAMERAKAEGNMTRSNVIKTLQEDPPMPTNARPKHLHKTRHLDVDKMIQTSIDTLHGVFLGIDALDEADWEALTPANARQYHIALNDLVGELRRFREKVGDVSRSALG